MDLPDLSVTALPWWHYVLALLLVIAGFVLARFARRGALRLLSNTPGVPAALADAAARFASYLIIFLGLGLGLAAIGMNIQPVLAIVLIVLVIAAFVLKGVADNFAAGVLLQTSHPVMPGDEVTVEIPDGTATGTVTELRSRTVVVRTYDGRTVHVPNAQMVGDAIVVTAASGLRRAEVQVRSGLGAQSVAALIARLVEVTASVDGVDAETTPAALPVTISSERLTATVRFWHRNEDAATVTAAAVLALASALAHDGLDATVTSLAVPAPLTPPDAV